MEYMILCEIIYSQQLDGRARYTGRLLVTVEGFGLRPTFICPSCPKRDF